MAMAMCEAWEPSPRMAPNWLSNKELTDQLSGSKSGLSTGIFYKLDC